MKEFFETYLGAISSKLSHEETSEIGYRTDFEILLKNIFATIKVGRIDHDARAKQGNKPDFVVIKGEVPILYIEAKDIGVSLDKVEKSEQMSRYFGYANLVLTDYVEFRFYRNGLRYGEPIKIAEYDKKTRTVSILSQNFELAAQTLLEFTQSYKEPIKSGIHLSKIMGGKAQRIRDNVLQFLNSESESSSGTLKVFETIKKLLVHDLTLESFADMYAQTLVYGLFVARYHDETSESFTRQEARDLIPKSNPFLREFFDHIVGPSFDKRLEYIVDELCEVFSHSDVKALMEQYYKKDAQKSDDGPDLPVIHFYEDFLKEYDPDLRKKMGAYYTPISVVRFIVRAVDDILEKEFKLSGGLANTSKLPDGKHRVQILDPATGTGTFISATIRKIYEKLLKQGQKGRWPAYVQNDLLPRLHGFELMMAPYTIAHLKLSMAFDKTGFKYFNQKRLGIYLTNSLEETTIQQDLLTGFGLAESIAEESKEAAKIKNNTPIMVVLGNPPYSVSSSNKGRWIQDLIKVYKEGLGERNIQPLSDDYIKFIRFAEHFIEKNGSGVVAMITNNSFLDGIIHRQMRKHLLETFDDIYIVNLHGNSKKKETALDGSKDENVFDIQQGVAISIFVKKISARKELGKVAYSDLYGSRSSKFKILDEQKLTSAKWQRLKYSNPDFFFIPKDFTLVDEYSNGFQINDLFGVNSVGIVTSRDSFLISHSKEKLEERRHEILNLGITDEQFENKYHLKTRYFAPDAARKISQAKSDSEIVKCFYRPLDTRYILYDKNFIERNRFNVMKHMFTPNLALVCSKQSTRNYIDNIQISNSVIELKFNSHDRNSNIFPLYLYSDDGSRETNLNPLIVKELENLIGQISPENILDYVYAVLHSPNYREKYREFLKIDFPRVPYPKNAEQFKKLATKGKELRELHLMESPALERLITTFPEEGDDSVTKVEFKDNKVYINQSQYFGNVPELVWKFYIGGYQPAQKWLKDRKGRVLTNEDIEHYQKIIKVLVETDRIMKEIDKIEV
jgi:predicted helicase